LGENAGTNEFTLFLLFDAEHNGWKILEPKSIEKSRVSSVNIAQHADLGFF
jgi:hypothetical protein